MGDGSTGHSTVFPSSCIKNLVSVVAGTQTFEAELAGVLQIIPAGALINSVFPQHEIEKCGASSICLWHLDSEVPCWELKVY